MNEPCTACTERNDNCYYEDPTRRVPLPESQQPSSSYYKLPGIQFFNRLTYKNSTLVYIGPPSLFFCYPAVYINSAYTLYIFVTSEFPHRGAENLNKRWGYRGWCWCRGRSARENSSPIS